MERITLHDKNFVPYISNTEIEAAIDSVAEKVNGEYAGSSDIPIVLCVLNGAIMFTAELMKRLDFNCELMSIRLSSYEGTSTTGKVKIQQNLTGSVKGRRVIISEDIVDTGLTIDKLKEVLKENGASDIKVCCLFFKEESFRFEEKPEYVAIPIENRFIVGFGLDYNEIGRNLKDVWILEQ